MSGERCGKGWSFYGLHAQFYSNTHICAIDAIFINICEYLRHMFKRIYLCIMITISIGGSFVPTSAGFGSRWIRLGATSILSFCRWFHPKLSDPFQLGSSLSNRWRATGFWQVLGKSLGFTQPQVVPLPKPKSRRPEALETRPQREVLMMIWRRGPTAGEQFLASKCQVLALLIRAPNGEQLSPNEWQAGCKPVESERFRFVYDHIVKDILCVHMAIHWVGFSDFGNLLKY